MNPVTELLQLTHPYVDRPDLIQGPGGNTSVKHEGNMYIKASGFRFEEMSQTAGFSCVAYQPIVDFFHQVIPSDKQSDESGMLELVSSCIQKQSDGLSYPKPSMETGFHAVLDKYVVHTHSVWSNLINCNSNKLNIVESLKSKGIISVEIPFVSPGFGLSYLVTQALILAKHNNQPMPEVFFLANHGIIAHSNSMEKVWSLLDLVDETIANAFNLTKTYPSTKIHGAETYWKPASEYALDLIMKYQADEQFFEQVLFPDQTVFFKGHMSFDSKRHSKINIGKDGIVYNCSNREARSIHETMTAYLFIYDTIINHKNTPQYIESVEIDYINSMSMEKHRKSLFDQK